jgi:hypothetical protein
MKLKDTLGATLLALADRRWTLTRLFPLRPAPNERYGWGQILLKALLVGSIWAVVACGFVTMIRGGESAWWALEYGFWPAFMASLVWGTLTRFAWNRRAAVLAQSGSKEPTKTRLPWWLRWLLGPFYLLLLGIALPLVLVVSGANLRAKLAWESYRRELVAAGVKLTAQEIAPPSVPDDQNFAATPMYRDLSGFFSNTEDPIGKAAQKRLSDMRPPGMKDADRGDWRRQRSADMAAIQRAFREDKDTSNFVASADSAAGVLETMKHWDTDLAELTEAAKRPHSQFPIRYEDAFVALLPHLAPLRGQAQLFSLRATAEVQNGKAQEALNDVLVGLRLGDAVVEEPLLISSLVGIAIYRGMDQPIWEGLKAGVWNEAQLARLEAALAGSDAAELIRHGLLGERAFNTYGILQQFGDNRTPMTGLIDVPQIIDPRLVSFIGYRNVIAVNRFYDRMLSDPSGIVSGPTKSEPDRTVSLGGGELREGAELELLGPPRPGNLLARMLIPAINKTRIKAREAQANVGVVRTAIALERFKLAHGKYPAALTELVPSLLAKVPQDPFSGDALIYRQTSDGRFLVYSVGPNGKDDRGMLASKPESREKAKDPADDIAWAYVTPQP